MGKLLIALPEVADFLMKTTPESNSFNWARMIAVRFIWQPPLDGCRRDVAKLKRRSQCGKLPTFITSLRQDSKTIAVLCRAERGMRFTNLTDGGDIGIDSIDSSMTDLDTEEEAGEQHIPIGLFNWTWYRDRSCQD